MTITRPKIGDHFQLRGTQIVAEVKQVSIGWISLEVESDDMSMHWRESSREFPRRWLDARGVHVMNRPLDEPLHPRRSQADRRRDVISVMQIHPEYSDRRLARIAVVSRELVTKIRRELIRRSVIESCYALHRIGADGKHYRRLPQPQTRGARL